MKRHCTLINLLYRTGTYLGVLTLLSVWAGLGPDPAQAEPFAYISNEGDNTVSVIDTATNTVTATVPVGVDPFGVAVHPAGTFVYVANVNSNTVSVIDTATNTVTATVPVGVDPVAFGQFIRPSVVVPFAAFNAQVEIDQDKFEVKGTFTLGSGSDGIDIPTERVSLQLSGGSGVFSLTIPAGSFEQDAKGRFKFEGVIDGVEVEAVIRPLGGNAFKFEVAGKGADLTGIANPVTVTLTVGDDSGSTTVEAEFE